MHIEPYCLKNRRMTSNFECITPCFEHFRGAVSLEKKGRYLKPWRIPFEKKNLFASPADSLLKCLEMCAGVRLSFQTDSRIIALNCKVFPDTKGFKFDLLCDGALLCSMENTPGVDEIVFANLSGYHAYEIYLPQKGVIEIESIHIEPGCRFNASPDKKEKWITYGSSITHCSRAASPSKTWPAITAIEKNFDLTCLGFSDNCHLDPLVAFTIRDLPADYISISAGINIKASTSYLRVPSFDIFATGVSEARQTLKLPFIGLPE